MDWKAPRMLGKRMLMRNGLQFETIAVVHLQLLMCNGLQFDVVHLQSGSLVYNSNSAGCCILNHFGRCKNTIVVGSPPTTCEGL